MNISSVWGPSALNHLKLTMALPSWRSSSEVKSLSHVRPMDCSPAGPSIRGIFQARVLEWGATVFSEALKVLSY